MSFSVETLTDVHAVAWLKLRQEGALHFSLGFLLTAKEAAAMFEERAEEFLGHGGVRGVFYNNELIGFAGYRRHRFERTCYRAEIGPFYVAPNYQGSGAAIVLIEAILDEAQTAGVEQLELHVDAENLRAINFYEKVGFERMASYRDNVRINGLARDDHFYRMRLASRG